MENGTFFLKENFVFWWGLRPRPNLPRPWDGPGYQLQKVTIKSEKFNASDCNSHWQSHNSITRRIENQPR